MGISSPQKASLNACQRSLPEAFSFVCRSIFRPTMRAVMISAAPMISPGMTPALNRSPMEVSAMEPYTTKVMEGGMITPMAPAHPISAAENGAL